MLMGVLRLAAENPKGWSLYGAMNAVAFTRFGLHNDPEFRRWLSERILETPDLPAGDFVRWVRQVIDLAGQIAQAPGTEALAPKCRQLVTVMRRDIADFAVDED